MGTVSEPDIEYRDIRCSHSDNLPALLTQLRLSVLISTYQTGHLALHTRAQLRENETLLVHAGAGGVGSAAIQLGLAAGARVIATAGGPEKVKVLQDLGADLAVDYTADDFVAVVKEATGGRATKPQLPRRLELLLKAVRASAAASPLWPACPPP